MRGGTLTEYASIPLQRRGGREVHAFQPSSKFIQATHSTAQQTQCAVAKKLATATRVALRPT